MNNKISKNKIYADHAATTKLDEDALLEMQKYQQEEYGNPSALYSLSRKPHIAITNARDTISQLIGASTEEIFFTSCGTEADNWAIKGVAFKYLGEKKRIITSCIEHHAVLNTCAFLEKIGFDIVYLPVNEKGKVSTLDLEKAINDSTILVSIMMANNEIGTIQEIEELAIVAHKHNVLFHTDAVQTIGHVYVNIHNLKVDLLSASAHKFNGPKGVGFLYVKKGIIIENLLSGGGQEKFQRAGTENVAGIVGMSIALKKNCHFIESNTAYLNKLVNYFWYKMNETELVYLSNGAEDRVPGSISISIKGANGEMLMHCLDLMGIMVSTGSACNSEKSEISHVLKAIEIPEEFAFGTLRITLGLNNTTDDIEKIVMGIRKILNGRLCS